VTSLVIRAAEPADMPALSEVYRRSSLSNDGDRPGLLAHPEFLEFSDLAVREGRTRVAVSGDRVAGFATWLGAAAVDDVVEVVEVEDLFVDPDWMRQGIGTALVLDLIEIARDAGARRAEVTGNQHALAFYQSVGFTVDHEVATLLGSGLRMHLDLTP
jgi:GNAT superfamily N-acetyltransferase